jgi:N-methylhydantoinase A
VSRVGVDTGGTFTDLIAFDGTSLRVAKRLSTPGDPAAAVLDGVSRVTERAGEVVHSSTVATNALLTRAGGPTVLVATAGFEDLLELRRQARPKLYALHPVVEPPLVGEPHRIGIDERMSADGTPLRAPAEAALRELREKIAALGAKSIAVCLLHAYANPAHERAVAEALAPLGLPISLSSEVLPLPREYERTSTTVADAYVRPVMAPYLERLERALKPARLRVMLSNGGAREAEAAARHPVRTLLSGPAAGVVGALAIARAAGVEDLITFDMGGTSTDVALVSGGRIATTEDAEVAGCPIQLPMLAVHTVGAGGGSIARVDEGGALKVGPQSAGADPGPAAYGRGGREPTVTDANLVLGRLDPARFLGGEMRLDAAAARAVLAPLADRLGRSIEAAAEDVLAVADAVMARAVRRISVERGEDPARFTLVPFGGAGAMHACAVARELGISRVLVPPSPGLLCAYGALIADRIVERVETRLRDVGPRLDAALLDADFARLEAEARPLVEGTASEPCLDRTVAMRYRGQSFELMVPAAGELVAAFHGAHRARFGYALDGDPVELVSLRLRACGCAEPAPLPVEPCADGDAQIARATCIFAGRAYGASVLERRRLREGARFEGPALIVEYSATTFVPPDARAEVGRDGCLALVLK